MQFPFYSTQYEPKMIYIPTPPNGGLLEILLEFLKEGMNLNGNFQRGEGVQWTSLFPVLLCSTNGDSNRLNTTIGTL